MKSRIVYMFVYISLNAKVVPALLNLFFSWSYEKNKSANQNSPMFMKTTNIELFKDYLA